MDKQELKDLTVSIFDKLRQAIKTGDEKKALELVSEIDRQKHALDESYREWIDLMLTYIGDHCGEEAVYEIHRKNGENTLLPMFESYRKLTNIEDKIRKRAVTWTDFHMSTIKEIEEDDEKFTFKIRCDSGGNIRLWPKYGKTKEAHPWSHGEKDFCYYCAHCPIVLEIMCIEQTGYPAWISEPQPGGMCHQYFYKDLDAIPEKYYKRVGMEKRKKA